MCWRRPQPATVPMHPCNRNSTLFLYFCPTSEENSRSFRLVAVYFTDRSFFVFASLLSQARAYCWAILYSNPLPSPYIAPRRQTISRRDRSEAAIMGANLSTTVEPDLSKVVWSPTDQAAGLILAVLWAGALYTIAMIFSTLALVDRWRGPHDKNATTGGSVMAAVLLSTAWPIVLAYIMMNSR